MTTPNNPAGQEELLPDYRSLFFAATGELSSSCPSREFEAFKAGYNLRRQAPAINKGQVLFGYAAGPQLDKLVPPAVGKNLTNAVALYANCDFEQYAAPTIETGQDGVTDECACLEVWDSHHPDCPTHLPDPDLFAIAERLAEKWHAEFHWRGGLAELRNAKFIELRDLVPYFKNYARHLSSKQAASVEVPEDVAKDATRYRWLRESGNAELYVWAPGADPCRGICGEGLDASIDAAMLAAAPSAGKEKK